MRGVPPSCEKVLREWLGPLQFPRGVRVGIDVDPYSFV